MKWHRIQTILLHSWYHFHHSMETWVDVFWMNAVNVAVGSFMAVYFARYNASEVGLYMMVGMIFWNILWGGQYAMTVGVLWEIWSRNLTSMFIAPLTLAEFLMAQIISGFIKSVAAVIVAAIIAYAIFGFSIFSLGPMLVVYSMVLFFFSCSLGMLVLGLVLRFGTDVQSLSWSIVYLTQPLGAVFYPVSVLPPAMQTIAWGIPTTYMFESIRGQLGGRGYDPHLIMMGTLLTGVYCVVGYIFLQLVYRNSLKSGAFARMEG